MPWRTFGRPGPCSGACGSSTRGLRPRAPRRAWPSAWRGSARRWRRCARGAPRARPGAPRACADARRRAWRRRRRGARGVALLAASAARAAAVGSAPRRRSLRRSPRRPRPPRRVVSVVSSGSQPSSLGVVCGRVDAALARDGQGASEVALGGAQAGGVLQLAGGVLEAQAEQVAPRGRDVLAQPVVVEVSQLGRLHH